MNEFSHHGADDEFGRLAGSGEAYMEAASSIGFVQSYDGGHVKRFAQEGMTDLRRARLTLMLLPDSCWRGSRPARCCLACIGKAGMHAKDQ